MLWRITKLRYLCTLSLKNGIPNCTNSRAYAISNLPWCCLTCIYRLQWVFTGRYMEIHPKPLSNQLHCTDLVTPIIRPCHNAAAAISKDLNHNRRFLQCGLKTEFSTINSQSSMSHHWSYYKDWASSKGSEYH